MTGVPAVTPVTTPVAEPTVASAVLLLHTPPLTVSPRVMVKPTHTLEGPVMTAGVALTVMFFITEQLPSVYEIVTGPVVTPETTPVPDTVATAVDELLHVPPDVASLRVIVEPTQAADGPVIGAKPDTTLTVAVAVQPEPSE